MHLLSRQPLPRTWSAPEGSRVYAIGDIHGRRDLLDTLLAKIAEDADDAPARRVVVFLGDAVDRGPESAAVLDRLCAGPPPGFEWVFLRGNHEDFMDSFLRDSSQGWPWLFNGGAETVASYVGERPDTDDLEAVRDALARAIPPAHRHLLAAMALSHREGDYFFVHAGIRPGVALDAQIPRDLMWIRGEFLESRADHGVMVVHGHSIAPKPQLLPNRIGVDTGAFASGVLTAVVLEGTDRRVLQT